MTHTYTTTDKKNWIYQPQFSRSRQRYRGPHESLKENTEMYQLRYDILNLKRKFLLNESDILSKLDLLVDGAIVPDITFYDTQDLVYNSEVLEDVPIAYWRLAEAEGRLVAVNIGTATGIDGFYVRTPTSLSGPLLTDDAASGKIFSDDQYIYVVDNASLDITGNLTIEFWYKLSDVDDTNTKTIIKKGDSGTGIPFWVKIINNNQIQYTQGTPSVNSSVTWTLSPALESEWYHIVLTKTSGNSVTLYVNSVSNGAQSPSVSATASNESLFIGNDDAVAIQPALGGLAEVALYNSVLSSGRITDHYETALRLSGTTVSSLFSYLGLTELGSKLDDMDKRLLILEKGFI